MPMPLRPRRASRARSRSRRSCPKRTSSRARLLSEVGEPLEAIEAARRTLQLEPRLTHLQYNVIARAWALLGDWEAANACYAHLPGDQDGASLYWMSRTRSLMWMNTPEVAIRELDTAAVVAPFATLPIVRTAAEILRDRKLPDMQRAYLGERARTAPTKRMRTFWHQLLAEMKCYIGEPSAAIADIEAASGTRSLRRAMDSALSVAGARTGGPRVSRRARRRRGARGARAHGCSTAARSRSPPIRVLRAASLETLDQFFAQRYALPGQRAEM